MSEKGDKFHTTIQGWRMQEKDVFHGSKWLTNHNNFSFTLLIGSYIQSKKTNMLGNLLGKAFMPPNKLDQSCDHRGLGLMRESRLDSERPVA